MQKKTAKTCYCQPILLNKVLFSSFFSRVKISQFLRQPVAKTPSQVSVVPKGSNKVCGGTGPLGCKHLGKFCVAAVGMVKKLAEME